MKIIALIKPTPDSTSGYERGIGSLDLYALSHALELRDRTNGSVHVIVLGTASASNVAQRALASGADEATHLVVEQPEHLDALTLAKIIRSTLPTIDFDVIFAGQSSDDLETGLVGPMLAELLNISHLSTVTNIRTSDDSDQHLIVERDVIGGKHILKIALPALLVILSGRDIPLRYPTPRGMIGARKKPLHTKVIEGIESRPDIHWSDPVKPERSGDGEVIRDVPAGEAARRIASWLKQRGLTG